MRSTLRLMMGVVLAAAACPAFAEQTRSEVLVDQTVQHYRLPGIAVGVIEDGRIVQRITRGELVTGEGRPVDADTLFEIASNTKAMTAAVLARLVQAGKLRWDDPVTRYLPQFRMYDPWVTANMQVRDLLIHNSGLGLGAGDLMLWPEPNHFDRADIIAGLAHLKPTGGFRSDYAYDNLMYVVAGEVAAAAGGKPYSTLVREEIFQPLGMDRCQVGEWSPAAVGNIARPHYRNGERNVAAEAEAAQVADFPSMAAGGIRCSLNDMLRWMQVLLDPAQAPGWLDQTQRRALWTAHMPMPISQRQRDWDNSHFSAYGYGWRLSDMDGQWRVAHTGTLSGMYSSLALLPDHKTGVVMLINGEAEDARSALTQALLKQYTAPASGHDVLFYAAQMEQAAQQRRSAGHVRPALKDRRAARPAELAAQLGVWRDPWFGEVRLCAAGAAVSFRSSKSPALQGPVMRSGTQWFVAWQDLGEDADAWLEFSGDAAHPVLGLRAIDPDIDFSYDYQDLQFRRVSDCP